MTPVKKNEFVEAANNDDSISTKSEFEIEDEFDREIRQLEEDILREKLEMVRRKETAEQQMKLLEFENQQRVRRDRSLFAELRRTELLLENTRRVTELTRNDLDNVRQRVVSIEQYLGGPSNWNTARERPQRKPTPKQTQELNCCIL